MGVHVQMEVYFLLSVKVSGKKDPQAGNAVKQMSSTNQQENKVGQTFDNVDRSSLLILTPAEHKISDCTLTKAPARSMELTVTIWQRLKGRLV